MVDDGVAAGTTAKARPTPPDVPVTPIVQEEGQARVHVVGVVRLGTPYRLARPLAVPVVWMVEAMLAVAPILGGPD
ncbi:MAG: hypothetical protein M1582_01660 [Actinobacteria bacterium]|nr:hypothetical protein [Actinomycetota bacterium]